MAKKLFKYVIFNFKTGTILNTIEPSKDTTLLDINNTGSIELDIPFYTLTNAQRKDISNLFEPINRGIALIRLNELGESIGCVDAGMIVKREFSVEDQSAHIQTTGFSGYLSKIAARWVTDTITTKPAPTYTYSGTPAQIYQSILNGALKNSDGISTIQNWETDFGSNDARTDSLKFPLTDFYTAQDAIEEVRDEIFEGKAAEIRWVPMLIIGSNKIKWVARTSKNDNSLINVGLDPKELPLKSWEPSVREISSYEINEDANDIYNYLVIDASEGDGDNETVFIKAKNETDAGKLTIFQSFDTGVDLSSSQMDSQLNSRLKNADVPEKSGTITLTGTDLSLENIPYSYELDGTNHYVNYGTLGRRIKSIAGSKASGLGTTLRCTEMSLSIREWDTSLTLTLQTITNVYPSLPAQRKLEKKEKKKRTSTKKQKKDRDKKNKITKGGTDYTIDSDFNWDGTDSGDPDDTVGGIDTPEKPELEPDKLPDTKPSGYTIGSVWKSWYAKQQLPSGDTEINSPIFKWKDDNYWGIGYSIQNNSTLPITNPINLYFQRIKLDQVKDSEIIKKSSEDTLNYVKNIKMVPLGEIMDLAKSRFPETFTLYRQPWNTTDPSQVTTNVINSNWKTRTNRQLSFYCFVINHRFYGHLIIQAKSGDSWDIGSIWSEVFFTAELSDDLTALSNYEVLTSPSQQIWGSTGMHKIISLNSLPSSDSTKGVFVNNNTNYYSLSGDNKRLIFPNADFIFSRKYLEQSGTSGGPKGFLPWATEQEYGIKYDEMNTEFGLLEADFSSKQPVFKKSTHSLPYPKQNQYPTLGNVYNESWQKTISNVWNGNHTYTSLNVFKPFFVINENGTYLTLASQVSQSTLDTFFEGQDFNQFTQKYMNKAWKLSKNGSWEEINLGTKNDASNQKAIWGVVAPDSKVLHSIMLDGGKPVVKSGKDSMKLEMIDDFTQLSDSPLSFVATTAFSNLVSLNDFPKNLFMLPYDAYYRMIGNLKESKYKVEINKLPYNKNISILKSKEAFFNNPIWTQSEITVAKSPSTTLALKYGSDKILKDKNIFLPFSEEQVALKGIKIDFKEFASWRSCNVGIDSNGDLWSWGIKIEKNINNITGDAYTQLYEKTDLYNIEPVKINLPWKIKKVNIIGDIGSSFYFSSINKKIIGITEDGKPFIMGYFQVDSTGRKYLEPRLINVTNNTKIDDICFAQNHSGIYAIGEDKSLYYNNFAINKTSPFDINLSNKNTLNNFEGKVLSISNIASTSNQTCMLLTTTDGEVWGYGKNWGSGENQNSPIFSKLNISDKVKFAIAIGASNYSIMAIGENGTIYRSEVKSSSSSKWDTYANFKNYTLPDSSKAKDFIYDQETFNNNYVMIFAKNGDLLTESSCVVSLNYLTSTNRLAQPDNIGALYSDGYIYGSEVDTGSLLPDFDFMPDGEGSEGQDWATNPWLPQTGDGKSPTPGEGEIVTDEGETADGRVAGQIEIPAEWMDESGGEVPPVVAPG